MPDPIVPRVVITSSIRWAWLSEVSAFVRVLDLEQERVTFVAPVPESDWRADDPNPRGGQRGARGVSVHGDRLVLANAERLFVFDSSWRLVGNLTHLLTADVHEVLAEERGIWVTAAGCDLLLQLDWAGQLQDWWSFRADRRLVKELGFRGSLPRLDPDLDYRDPRVRLEAAPYDTIHLNGLVRSGDALLLSFGRVMPLEEGSRSSAVVRLPERASRFSSRRASIVLRCDAPEVPNHNVAEEGDLLVYNDSNRNCLVAWDRRLGEERCAVVIPGEPGFARGLARIGPSLWLVGSQAPCAVYAVDLERAEIVASYPLGGVENETVFGICPLPGAFAQPEQPEGDDPYAFWKRVAPGPAVTPIPTSRAGPPGPGRA